MTVVAATAAHVADVQRWLAARGKRPYPTELLVGHGFVVEGVAACWLYATGTPLMLLEHLVGNPDVDGETRGDGIDAVVAAAFDRARELGGRYVYAMTRLPGVVERSRKHGFEVVREGSWMIAANIGGNNE